MPDAFEQPSRSARSVAEDLLTLKSLTREKFGKQELKCPSINEGLQSPLRRPSSVSAPSSQLQSE